MPLVVGIDPSLAKTGLCLFDTNTKVIGSRLISLDEKVGTSFVDCYKTANRMVEKIRTTLKGIDGTVTRIVMESPPPMGQWSSGLSILDGQLLNHLRTVANIVVVQPNKIYSLLGRKGKKNEVRDLVYEIAEKTEIKFLKDRCDVSLDETDAIILSMWAASDYLKLYLPSSTKPANWVFKKCVVIENNVDSFEISKQEKI